jgi:hypothetical protein
MINSTSSPTEKPYDYNECKDMGFIIKGKGAGLAAECRCMERKRLIKRFKSAMIPDVPMSLKEQLFQTE